MERGWAVWHGTGQLIASFKMSDASLTVLRSFRSSLLHNSFPFSPPLSLARFRYGRLVRCDIPAPRSSSSKPYAFVEFEDSRDADDAYRDMHGRSVDGYKISIQWAKNPPRDSRDSRDRRDRSRSPRRERRGSRSPRRGGGGGGGRDRSRDRDRRVSTELSLFVFSFIPFPFILLQWF